MDIILPIIFLTFFVVTIVIVVYVIYDYLRYKNKVEKSIETASTEINKEFEKIIVSVDSSSEKVDKVDDKLIGYNNSLQKFFSFNDENNNVITNEQMFKHAFDGIIPNLQLISQVNAVSGMNIKTSTELINDKNMKICNDTDGCINMNVNSKGFNITPNSKVNNLTINDNDKIPLASFDLARKSIYLGGDNETNSPFFIKNNDVHIKNAKMYDGNSGNYITASSISKRLDAVSDVVDYSSAISSLQNQTTLNASDIQQMSKHVLVNYYISSTGTDPKKYSIQYSVYTPKAVAQIQKIRFVFDKKILPDFNPTSGSIDPQKVVVPVGGQSVSVGIEPVGENVMIVSLTQSILEKSVLHFKLVDIVETQVSYPHFDNNNSYRGVIYGQIID